MAEYRQNTGYDAIIGGDGNSHEALSQRAANQSRDDNGKFASGGGESGGGEKGRNRHEGSAQDISKLLGKEIKGVKGQQAVERLLKERQGHVKGAFYRDDLGDIDLIWGDDTCGLQHILLHREEQGIDAQEFVQDLAEVVEKGNYIKRNDKGNFEFQHDRKVAVVSPELRGNKLTFLVTAFKTRRKPR